jgi:hypothetical protein
MKKSPRKRKLFSPLEKVLPGSALALMGLEGQTAAGALSPLRFGTLGTVGALLPSRGRGQVAEKTSEGKLVCSAMFSIGRKLQLRSASCFL